MKGRLCLILGSALLLASTVEQAHSKGTPAQIERGKFLVTMGGCNDCHTPWKMGATGPEPDMTRYLSGHPAEMQMPPPPAAVGPWIIAGGATMTAWASPAGIAYSANLTSDMETGLGAWDEALFIRAMRSGKSRGAGRPVLPPMPWPTLAKLSDDDLKAMFAYLGTVPPVKNEVPQSVVAPMPGGAK